MSPVWLHTVSDTPIALVYSLVSLLLLYFAREREERTRKRIFILVGVFILLGGMIHVLSAREIGDSVYWLSGTLKIFAALVSVYTAIEWYLSLPRALALPSPTRLAAPDEELSRSIQERQMAEPRTLGLTPESERRVPQATRDLALANDRLRREIAERESATARLQELNHRLLERIQELETRTEEMIRLGETIDFLQTRSTVSEVKNALAERLPALFPRSSGAIFIDGDSRQSPGSVAVWGEIESRPDFSPRDVWLSLQGSVYREEANFDDLYRDRRAATLGFPMFAGGENLGFLYLVFEDPRYLTPDKKRLAETASKQIAVALANVRAREHLRALSFSDPLTGLYNRRYLEATLEREFNRCAREGRSIGVIFLDIDHFKRINDTFGHETGDKVLTALGDYLKTNTRQSDIACRYGGEEFVLVLLDSSLEDTRKRAEELCQGIRELELTREKPELSSISVSIGVSAFPVHGTTHEELFRVADEGLYRAKRSGRDRVCCVA